MVKDCFMLKNDLVMCENERLKELQAVLGFKSQAAFASALGIKQGSLSDVYRKKAGIKVSDSIKRVLDKDYSVNIEWLETGEGEMLSGSNVQTTEGNRGSGIVGNNVQGGGINNNHVNGGGISQNDEGVMHKLLDIIREKDAAIASKDAQIERLLDIILKERAHE